MIHIFIKFLTDEGELLTLKEARTCEHSNKWEFAMQEKIKALHEDNTWELVEVPKGTKPIPHMWVYNVKGEMGYRIL